MIDSAFVLILGYYSADRHGQIATATAYRQVRNVGGLAGGREVGQVFRRLTPHALLRTHTSTEWGCWTTISYRDVLQSQHNFFAITGGMCGEVKWGRPDVELIYCQLLRTLTSTECGCWTTTSYRQVLQAQHNFCTHVRHVWGGEIGTTGCGSHLYCQPSNCLDV